MRLALPALLLAAGLLLAGLAGCDEAEEWRDGQIEQSGQIAQGGKVEPPAAPIDVPDSVRRELPLDDSFTILSYSEGNGGKGAAATGSMTLEALSPWDATRTAQWLVARLAELGYDSGDNASRVLEGATYRRDGGRYPALYVKLGLNTADQVTVEYRGGPE